MFTGYFVRVPSKKGRTGKRGRPKQGFLTKPVRVHEQVYARIEKIARGSKAEISEVASFALADYYDMELEEGQ